MCWTQRGGWWFRCLLICGWIYFSEVILCVFIVFVGDSYEVASNFVIFIIFMKMMRHLWLLVLRHIQSGDNDWKRTIVKVINLTFFWHFEFSPKILLEWMANLQTGLKVKVNFWLHYKLQNIAVFAICYSQECCVLWIAWLWSLKLWW